MATSQALTALKALNVDGTTTVNKAFLDNIIDVLSSIHFAQLVDPPIHTLAGLSDVQIGGTQPTDPAILFWVKPVSSVDTVKPVMVDWQINGGGTKTDYGPWTITQIGGTDNVGVTGYLITSAPPSITALNQTPPPSVVPTADDPNWSATPITEYTIPIDQQEGDGLYSVYPWLKDAAGNVSAYDGWEYNFTVTLAPTLTYLDNFDDGVLDSTHFAITTDGTPTYTESNGSSSLLLNQSSGYQSLVCKDILSKPTNNGAISFIEITMQRGSTSMLRSINASNYTAFALPTTQPEVFALDAGLCYWGADGSMSNVTPTWTIPSSAYTGSNFVKHKIEVRNNASAAEYRITQTDSVTGQPVTAGSQSNWLTLSGQLIVTCDQWEGCPMTITRYAYYNAG